MASVRQLRGPCQAWPEDSSFIREVLDRIGDKWTMLVVSTLGAEPLRYSDLQASIPGISQRMLTQTLKLLERDGLLLMVDDDRFPLKPGETPEMRSIRFRTLGCYPLTGAIESAADTLPAVIQEMLVARTSERQGRVIDHDPSASMEKKKQEGYF